MTKKAHLISELKRMKSVLVAFSGGLTVHFLHVVHGTNVDDLDDFRPGLQAAEDER